MACGMVLVIAARQIDLSVGSVLGFTGMVIAGLSVEDGLPGAPLPWPAALAAGIALACAIGGSPVAAELAGIDVRGVTLRAFALLGALAGVAAVLTTARLGAGTNAMGSQAELAVIAAAVLGGTSLAGGTGSAGGAVLGALWMQSLENGMVLLDVTSALRQVLIGLVLLVAVAADARARRSAR